MIYYNYESFRNDVRTLAGQCRPFGADTIVAVARGGVTLAHALCMSLDIRNFQTIRAESYDGELRRDTLTLRGECDLSGSARVLIVDDIVDSGETLAELMPMLRRNHPGIEFKVATLFFKPAALFRPDFALHEATDWIDFFWERDFLTEGSV